MEKALINVSDNSEGKWGGCLKWRIRCDCKMLLLFPVVHPQLTPIVTVDATDRPSLPCKALYGAAHCNGPGHCKKQMLNAVRQLCLFSISLWSVLCLSANIQQAPVYFSKSFQIYLSPPPMTIPVFTPSLITIRNKSSPCQTGALSLHLEQHSWNLLWPLQSGVYLDQG